MQTIDCARALALVSAGRSKLARMAMIEITTRSSTNVNARARAFMMRLNSSRYQEFSWLAIIKDLVCNRHQTLCLALFNRFMNGADPIYPGGVFQGDDDADAVMGQIVVTGFVV